MAPWVAPPQPAPDPKTIEEVAAILASAERPLLIAGRGAISSDARDEIIKCGDKIGALLGTTLQAQRFFDTDYDIGIVGSLGHGQAMQLVDEADAVVAIGSALNVYTSGFGQLFPKAKLVHIDNRPEAFGNMTPVDISPVADAC